MGDDKFVESMRGRIKKEQDLSEVPASQHRPVAKELSYYANKYPSRNDAIVAAYASNGYTLKEIGDYFNLHYSTVSGIVRNHKAKA